MGGATYERELKKDLLKEGWLVFRSAGSFVCDLIALKPDDHMLIEVKSTSKKKFNISYSKRDKEQFNMLNNLAKEGFNVYYWIRWKGKKHWTKHQLPLNNYPVFEIGDK